MSRNDTKAAEPSAITPAVAGIAVEDRKAAQARLERIQAFQLQLRELLQTGVLDLSEDQRSRVDNYLETVRADLAARFDVDISETEKRFSLGMRIASTLGGLAFCLALVLFFYRFWGQLYTGTQVILLAAAPLLGLALLGILGKCRAARYYVSLAAIVVLGSFILNLTAIGFTFNITPTPNAMLAWGAFALVVAYGCRLDLPLAAGLAVLTVFFSATSLSWTGGYWESLMERPEGFLPGGLLAAAIPAIRRNPGNMEFDPIYRLVGMSMVLFALTILMHRSAFSYLPLPHPALSIFYQLVAFLTAAAVIGWGVSQARQELFHLGSAAFVLFLFDRFFIWWWDWMPRYLFFLVIGLAALSLLFLFRRLRMLGRRSV